MKKAEIYMHDKLAGTLVENDEGYHFNYEDSYLLMQNPEPVNLTLPVQQKYYFSRVLFPFFDGLIPEAWLLDIVEQNWKINPRDRMSILLATC